MNSQGENPLLTKLKQTIIQKEEENKFKQIMKTNIRLNKNDSSIKPEISSIVNTALPSISNAKASLSQRNKSHSAKRITHKLQLQKSSNNKSVKKISQQLGLKGQHDSSNKVDIEGMMARKLSVLQNSSQKQTILRSKIFSLKTPFKDGDVAKEIPATKQSTLKNGSSGKTQTALKQFTAKIQSLNEQLLLTIKFGRLNPDSLDNKKVLALIAKFSPDQANKITLVIQKLTRFVQKFKIQNGNVQFKGLLKLISKKVLSNHDLISLFTNKSELIKQHNIIGEKYYTVKELQGRNLAATRIISFFRMIHSKQFYKKFKALNQRIRIIQRHWRNALLIRQCRKRMLQSTTAKMLRYSTLQQQLCKKWSIIKTSKRFEVHICSYSLEEFKRLTIKNLKHRQNNQITRIFKAMETDVNVIYVAPFQLHQEVIRYFQSVLSFDPTVHEKIYFIVPENALRLEQYGYLTTTALLLYSPKALKRIRQIVGSDYAYIVPSFPSMEYVNLSAVINMPILGCSQNLAKLYSTKSGCLNLLLGVSQKEKPPFQLLKSVKAIFSQKELINSLAILIHKNHQVKQWYFKIEDEIHSRGLAYVNINKINFLRQLCSQQSPFQGVQQNQIIGLIAQQLNSKLKSRLKIINKDVYANYEQYISHFLTRGGIIQAGVQSDKATQFSISFFIDPLGQFTIIGTYNKLQLGGKSISQSIKFPSSLSSGVIDYQGITRHLYKQFWVRQKLWGYFTVDFIHSSSEQLPYAIGLDCFLNEKTASIFMVNFCGRTRYDKDKNSLVNWKDTMLHYVYCPSISLFNVPSTTPFFKGCKFENISYDLERKVGTIFVMLDKIQSQQLGYFCIQQNMGLLLKELKKMVEYFCKNYRQSKSSHDQIGLLKGLVTIWLKRSQKQHKALVYL